jgi:hypothetical protein
MPKLGKLLTELLLNAGYDIKENADAVGSLLALDQDVPDDVSSVLKSSLLTLEAAKNNTEIKKHFTAQALNTVDTGLYEYADEYKEIPEDSLSAIRAEKSSYKKIRMMLDALKGIEASKAGAAGKGANVETQQQLDARKHRIDELTAELLSSKTSSEQKINDATRDAQNRILNYAQNSELGMKKYAQGELDMGTNVLIARQIVDSFLKQIGAAPMAGDDGSIRLVQAQDPEMDFMLENKKVTYSSLADKILGEKKLLHVSDPHTAGAGNGAGKTNYGNAGAGGSQVNADAAAMYDQQIAKLTGAQA